MIYAQTCLRISQIYKIFYNTLGSLEVLHSSREPKQKEMNEEFRFVKEYEVTIIAHPHMQKTIEKADREI